MLGPVDGDVGRLIIPSLCMTAGTNVVVWFRGCIMFFFLAGLHCRGLPWVLFFKHRGFFQARFLRGIKISKTSNIATYVSFQCN